MALFDLSEINMRKAPVQPATAVTEMAGTEICAIAPKLAGIKDELARLKSPGTMVHFCTHGRFSGHELLFYLLQEVTGPADVYLATWKISPEPARMLVQALDRGLITNLHVLVERRMTIKSPNAEQLIRHQATSYGMCDIHAKVLVLDRPDCTVSVVMSANLSDNRRIEAGVGIHSRSAAIFHIDWITHHIDLWQREKNCSGR